MAYTLSEWPIGARDFSVYERDEKKQLRSLLWVYFRCHSFWDLLINQSRFHGSRRKLFLPSSKILMNNSIHTRISMSWIINNTSIYTVIPTWRITPLSKWLVKEVTKQCITRPTLLRGRKLTMVINHLQVMGWPSKYADISESQYVYTWQFCWWPFWMAKWPFKRFLVTSNQGIKRSLWITWQLQVGPYQL